MENEVGDLLGSPDGLPRRRDVGFRVGFRRIAGCRDVGVQESDGWSKVFKGWVQAGAEIEEIAEVVHESERDVVRDQISLEVLFRALLGVEAGNGRQGSLRPEGSAGYFQVVVRLGEPSVLRPRGGHRGLRSLRACG